MTYNFDEIIDRKNTQSLKFDFPRERGMPEDVLPMWVADMDFQTPIEVRDALVKRSQHGIFGYSQSDRGYYETLEKWFLDGFHWQIHPKWLVKTPGVVYAVTTAIHAFSEKGDGVLIQEPVYYPFKASIEVNERRTVVNQLVLKQDRYEIDFDDFERKIVEEKVKLFILCSPHNPVGRVWTKEELIRMGDICLKHDVFVISDEIHADFIHSGHEHHVFVNLKEAYRDISIVCTAPSKTFNLAGLQISNIFIPNKERKHDFKQAIRCSGYDEPNIMGLVACQAAYEHGRPWLDALRKYLAQNITFAEKFFRDKLPEAKVISPEGTYLLWVDFSQVGYFKEMSHEAMDHFMGHKAKVWLDGGTMFGAGGEGFQRFNIACPRETLEKALVQLVRSIDEASLNK